MWTLNNTLDQPMGQGRNQKENLKACEIVEACPLNGKKKIPIITTTTLPKNIFMCLTKLL